MDLNLTNRTAIVTGGATGLGESLFFLSPKKASISALPICVRKSIPNG